MNCPNCNIPVKPYYLYCPSCGTHLGVKRGGFWSVLSILAAVLFMTGGLLYFDQTDFSLYVTPKKSLEKSRDALQSQRILTTSQESSARTIHLPVGFVIIEDVAGNPIAHMPAAVSASGWLAIPKAVCLGGYNWYFRFADRDQTQIIGGIIGDDDEAGIWQIQNVSFESGPRISAGNMEQSFDWFSIISDKSQKALYPKILSEEQNFYHVLFGQIVKEPGVFIQNDAIVGWSFGNLSAGGFVWRGADENNLVFELSVDDFYRATFENSREEQFVLAYGPKDTDPLTQLEYFAQGFRLAPKLAENDTPAHLKANAAVAEMKKLISTLVQSQDGYNVARIFDSVLLSRIGDVGLLTDALNAVVESRGSENALDVLEGVLRKPQEFNKTKINQLKALQKELYKQWLTTLVNEGEYAKGIKAYYRAEEAFVDDPEIHILGVKLALSFNDWKTAQKILRSRKFPLDFADQVKNLEGQIAQLKLKESDQYQEKEKIVIQFEPGAANIPVAAVLNQSLAQNFVVDTGATRVTIPSISARKLGIDIESAPVHQLITAGAVISAPEVTLESIQIGPWIEHDVKAFIVDLPDQYGTGLLGLNYLNRFRMEVNSKTGTLTLTPRQKSD